MTIDHIAENPGKIKAERDSQIVAAYLAGLTDAQVGQRFGFSRQRAQQIRARNSVDARCRSFRPDEDAAIRAHLARGLPLAHLELEGRAASAAAYRATRLGLYKPRPATEISKPWTSSEITFLRRSYLKLSAGDIAERLGRTRNSVIGKADKLGVADAARRSQKAVRA